jgi:hypothetical protein
MRSKIYLNSSFSRIGTSEPISHRFLYRIAGKRWFILGQDSLGYVLCSLVPWRWRQKVPRNCKVETAGSFETSVTIYQTTWRHVSEDCTLYIRCSDSFTGRMRPGSNKSTFGLCWWNYFIGAKYIHYRKTKDLLHASWEGDIKIIEERIKYMLISHKRMCNKFLI